MAAEATQNRPLSTVWATHDFVAENEDELAFCTGEFIEVLEKDDQYGDGWWLGRDSNQRVGLFPASFVTELPLEAEGPAGEHETSYSASATSEPRSGHSSVGVDCGVEVRALKSPTPYREDPEVSGGVGNVELESLVAAAIAAVRADGAPIPSDEDEAKDLQRARSAELTTMEGAIGRGNRLQEIVEQKYDEIMRRVEPYYNNQLRTGIPSQSKVTDAEDSHESERLRRDKSVSRKEQCTPRTPLEADSTDIAKTVETLSISSRNEQIRPSAISAVQRSDNLPAVSTAVTYGSSLLSSGNLQPPKMPPPTGHPKDWSINDVSNWLKSRTFEAEATSFAENEITGAILLELDLTTLKELGVTSFGKRFNIMHAVADLKEEWDMSLVTTIPQDNLTPTVSVPLVRGFEWRDDPALHVPPSRRTGSYAAWGKSSDVSEDQTTLPRRDAHPRLPMPANDIPATWEFGRRPVSSFYSSRQEVADGGSSLPGSRVTRLGSVASRPAPTPPRTKVNKPALKLHTAGENIPWQPIIPARCSSVPPVDEHPPTNLKAPTSVSIPSSPNYPSPTASSSNSLRYLPKSDPSIRSESQQPAIDYHHVDGTNFLHDAEHCGWLYKQRGALKSWKKLWFSIKNGVLYYQKHQLDRRIVGLVELRGYRVVPDANIYRGKYCWKARHDRLRSHFFYTDEADDMRVWLKHMIKATIALDPDAPVISSYAAKTVPINVAQEMQPRPPNIAGPGAYSSRGSSRLDVQPLPTSASSSDRRIMPSSSASSSLSSVSALSRNPSARADKKVQRTSATRLHEKRFELS